MFGKYSEKDVKALVRRLKEEYDKVVARQRELTEEVKEENRILRARLSVLESQRGEISSALMHAVAEGERIKEEGAAQAESERKELLLLAEKCRLLTDRLALKYPDEDDCTDFRVFTEALRRYLGEETEETGGFRIEDVLDPKEPLDLGKLCRELGLMEEEE